MLRSCRPCIRRDKSDFDFFSSLVLVLCDMVSHYILRTDETGSLLQGIRALQARNLNMRSQVEEVNRRYVDQPDPVEYLPNLDPTLLKNMDLDSKLGYKVT